MPTVVEPLVGGTRVAIFVKVGAQTIAVDVERELSAEKIVDERRGVYILAIAHGGVCIIVERERFLHVVDRLVYCLAVGRRHLQQVVAVGIIILVCDLLAVVGLSVPS